MQQKPRRCATAERSPDAAVLLDALRGIISENSSLPFAVPGAVLAVSGPSGAETVVALGKDGAGRPLSPDSLYPIGSASKLGMGLLVLGLIDEGRFSLETPLRDLLPDAAAGKNPAITIWHLLTHTSGLPLEVAHELSEPPGTLDYRKGLTWRDDLAPACLAAVPVAEPGSGMRYSNIGYGLLALIAERLCGKPFTELLQERVFGPLGVEAYCGLLPRPSAFVAEISTPYGPDMEPGNSDHWRRMGSPWAGTITTAPGLLKLVRAYLDDSPVIAAETARKARSNQLAPGISGGFPTTEPFLGHAPSRAIVWRSCSWGLALEVQGGKRPHWAPSKLPSSFGQIGSSGCIAWCDPESATAWALLGTRSTDSGWLLLHGPRIAEAALRAASAAQQ